MGLDLREDKKSETYHIQRFNFAFNEYGGVQWQKINLNLNCGERANC